MYVKGTLNYKLEFKPAFVLSMEAYTKAQRVGNLSDRQSTSGFCVFFWRQLDIVEFKETKG